VHHTRISRRARRGLALAAVAALALTAAGCSSDNGDKKDDKKPDTQSSSGLKLPKLNGQSVQVAAVWTGAEQAEFKKVLNDFSKRTGAKVTYQATGDNVATFLGSKIQGGAPPDVAFLPQVGVLKQFAKSKWLKPLGPDAKAALTKNFSQGWQDLGTYQGTPYGVYFKGANKSLIWYNNTVFKNAGVQPPKTWADFLKTAQTISDSGVPPVSIGAGDGWVLTDWFENIYLSQAGPEKYDELAQHKIKWTDPSVKTALTTLAQLFGNKNLIAGGPNGALQVDFPKSVVQTFATNTKAGMVYEGDFVAVNITTDTKAKVGTDAKVFPFPAVGSGKAPVVSGGDVAVALKNSKGAQALLTYLASPEAAAVWAKDGSFLSPNKNLPLSTYPDAVTRTIAQALISAGDDFRFDMSDQAPAAFGGTKGEGEWKDLQDFLSNPKNIAGTQKKLESDAAKAYKNAG
jgi:ABC-type glycerol-3-phosphate transport system substrate-binding protein